MNSPSLGFFLCLLPGLNYFEEQSALMFNCTPRNALVSSRLTNDGLRNVGTC